MKGKIKTFWLNIGAIDRDLDLTGRQQILKSLSEENIEIRATFNYVQNNELLFNDFEILKLFKMSKTSIGKLLLILKQQYFLAKNMDVDVVVLRAWKLHETLPVFFLWRYILGKPKPKFILDLRTVPVDITSTTHNKLSKMRYQSSIKIALRVFDGITVISEKLRDDIAKMDTWKKTAIKVWTTGVDVERFNPISTANIREKIGLENRFVIMYHGIISPNRGLQYAIRAVKIVSQNFPEIYFLIIGKVAAENELKRLIQNIGLQNHVLINPPVAFKEIPKFINAADAGILPFPDIEDWNTSAPLKLFEYLAMGKPVIVTDIAAHRSVVAKEPFAFFAENVTAASLAEAIQKAIQFKENLPNIGKLARDFAVNNLTWNNQAKKIKQFFSDLVIEKNA